MMRAQAYLEPVMSIWVARREKTECCLSGHCMVPLIRHGDTLVIEHGRDHIRKGDIIVFKENGKSPGSPPDPSEKNRNEREALHKRGPQAFL